MEFSIKSVENGYIIEKKVNDEIKVFVFGGINARTDMIRFLLCEFQPQEIEDSNENWPEGI